MDASAHGNNVTDNDQPHAGTTPPTDRDLDALQKRVLAFVRARDWEQFHTPKNLAMALSVEASELVEIFQWLDEDAARDVMATRAQDVEDELADILIYLLRTADVLGVDLFAAADRKIIRNGARYPAAEVQGSVDKR